jgi:excisionase family DNA binding protein
LKKKGKEISVKKAAQFLKLSERTVINFIKQKKIEAIKVGRDWFVDYASFVSFAQKYDMRIFETREELSEVSEIFPNASKQVGDYSENSEKFPKDFGSTGSGVE